MLWQPDKPNKYIGVRGIHLTVKYVLKQWNRYLTVLSQDQPGISSCNISTSLWLSSIVGVLYEISYCLQVKRALEEGQMAWRNVKSFLITQRQGIIGLFWILSYTEHTVSEPLFFLHCRKEPGATPKDRNSSSQYTSKGYNSNHLIIPLTKLSNYTVRHSDVLVIYIYIGEIRSIVDCGYPVRPLQEQLGLISSQSSCDSFWLLNLKGTRNKISPYLQLNMILQ